MQPLTDSPPTSALTPSVCSPSHPMHSLLCPEAPPTRGAGSADHLGHWQPKLPGRPSISREEAERKVSVPVTCPAGAPFWGALCMLFADPSSTTHLRPGLSNFCLPLCSGVPFPVSDVISAQPFGEARLRTLLSHLLQPSQKHTSSHFTRTTTGPCPLHSFIHHIYLAPTVSQALF